MSTWTRLKSDWSRFQNDRSGLALIYVTVALPVIVGFALLAVDYGRLSTLQSSLQNGADALALAGAGELDRRPDAITRANRAIANLVTTNRSVFEDATGVVTIRADDIHTHYLKSLPASDADPIVQADHETTDPAKARYVQVIVDPKDFNTIFPATFIGAATNTAQSSAEAVAGFDAAVCNFTPMFICNPYEENGDGIMESTKLLQHFDRVKYPDRIGRLINMKQTGGSGAQYFPGNFGFLQPQPPNNPGAGDLRKMLGIANPAACFVANGVSLRTGNIESVRFGFNTRFDMYDGPMNGNMEPGLKYSDSKDYRPAQNVRKGVANDKSNGKGSACNPDDLTPTQDTSTLSSKLRRDTCFSTDTCPYMSGRMGDGVWEKQKYYNRTHNLPETTPLPSAISGQYVSRYDVYKFELEDLNARVKNDSNGTGGSAQGGEIGYPACNSLSNDPSVINNNPDRRIFHGAVLNCKALNASSEYGPITGNGGSKKPLPVVAFVKFFLTEPIPSAKQDKSTGKDGEKGNEDILDGDVWAEMVGIDTPGDLNSTARDIVQLYR